MCLRSLSLEWCVQRPNKSVGVYLMHITVQCTHHTHLCRCSSTGPYSISKLFFLPLFYTRSLALSSFHSLLVRILNAVRVHCAIHDFSIHRRFRVNRFANKIYMNVNMNMNFLNGKMEWIRIDWLPVWLPPQMGNFNKRFMLALRRTVGIIKGIDVAADWSILLLRVWECLFLVRCRCGCCRLLFVTVFYRIFLFSFAISFLVSLSLVHINIVLVACVWCVCERERARARLCDRISCTFTEKML